DSALIRWLLAHPIEAHGAMYSLCAPWIVDPYIARWLTDGGDMDAALGSSAWIHPLQPNARVFFPAELERTRSFLDALWHARAGAPVEVTISGLDGSGKRTLAAQVVAALG